MYNSSDLKIAGLFKILCALAIIGGFATGGGLIWLFSWIVTVVL